MRRAKIYSKLGFLGGPGGGTRADCRMRRGNAGLSRGARDIGESMGSTYLPSVGTVGGPREGTEEDGRMRRAKVWLSEDAGDLGDDEDRKRVASFPSNF